MTVNDPYLESHVGPLEWSRETTAGTASAAQYYTFPAVEPKITLNVDQDKQSKRTISNVVQYPVGMSYGAQDATLTLAWELTDDFNATGGSDATCLSTLALAMGTIAYTTGIITQALDRSTVTFVWKADESTDKWRIFAGALCTKWSMDIGRDNDAVAMTAEFSGLVTLQGGAHPGTLAADTPNYQVFNPLGHVTATLKDGDGAAIANDVNRLMVEIAYEGAGWKHSVGSTTTGTYYLPGRRSVTGTLELVQDDWTIESIMTQDFHAASAPGKIDIDLILSKNSDAQYLKMDFGNQLAITNSPSIDVTTGGGEFIETIEWELVGADIASARVKAA